MQAGVANIIGTFKNYRYYGFSISEFLFGNEDRYMTSSEKHQNLQKFTIELRIEGAIEKHELVFDRKESLNTLIQVNEWNHAKKQETRGFYLSCYYGLLIKEDFEQWKKEVELLLNDESAKDYSWSLIFNLPSLFVEKYSMQQLKGYFDFNDEEFKEYQFYFKTAVEKGFIFKEDLDKMSY